MTLTKPLIYDYTINDVSVCTGRDCPATNFHVYKTDEIISKEKMLHQAVRSDHFLISLTINGGSAGIKMNLTNYELIKNSLFIVPEETVHQFLGEQNGFNAIIIRFSRQFLTEAGIHVKFIEVFNFLAFQQKPHFILTDFEAQTLYSVMSLLHQRACFEDKQLYGTETLHLGFNLFMFELFAILKKYRSEDHFKTTRKEDLLMIFFKLLTRSFKEERSVRYYADSMFVTAKHLTKTVKELTKKTCGELIDEMVINEAKILLHDLSMSVGSVADTLHFSDQFFFSKYFKNHTGLTPSEYKVNL